MNSKKVGESFPNITHDYMVLNGSNKSTFKSKAQTSEMAHNKQNLFYLLSQSVRESFELSIEVDVFDILDLSVSTT